jgi:hypothetical protein
MTHFLPEKLTFYDRLLKPTKGVALERKVADEIRINTLFSNPSDKENR